MAVAIVVAPHAGLAGPAQPPGGHLPIHFGGNNRAGYPPLVTTAAPEKPAPLATGLALRAAPNPFTRSVALTFRAGAAERTSVRIFSRDGRLVRRLTAATAGEGTWHASWDGRDGRGRSVGPGLYFARIQAGSHAATLRVVRLK